MPQVITLFYAPAATPLWNSPQAESSAEAPPPGAGAAPVKSSTMMAPCLSGRRPPRQSVGIGSASVGSGCSVPVIAQKVMLTMSYDGDSAGYGPESPHGWVAQLRYTTTSQLRCLFVRIIIPLYLRTLINQIGDYTICVLDSRSLVDNYA